MMHWLRETKIPKDATIALIDPDFYFLRPLWHDSFDGAETYFASGTAKKTPFPTPLARGTMIAQRYGIGGKPWTRAKGRNGQKDWDLRGYFASVGRPDSPANALDLTENAAGTFYSIGAPYMALAADWLPIATNWTGLMPMAVERNFGNLAEMSPRPRGRSALKRTSRPRSGRGAHGLEADGALHADAARNSRRVSETRSLRNSTGAGTRWSSPSPTSASGPR